MPRKKARKRPLKKSTAKQKGSSKKQSTAMSQFMRGFPIGRGLPSGELTPRSRVGDARSYLEALKQNEHLAVNVLRLVSAFMFTPWHIEDKKKDGQIVEEGPVVDLFRNPNEFMTWSEFIETEVLHFVLVEAFIKLERTSIGGQPTELWPLGPDRTAPIPDKDKFISGYEFKAGTKTLIFKPEEVVHIKRAHPTNLWRGLGTVEAAERLFNVDIAMAEYVWRYFINATQTYNMFTTEGKLSKGAWDRFEAELMEMHSGVGNAHRPIVLENGMKFAPQSGSPRETDYQVSRQQTEKSIRSLTGMTPMRSGDFGNANRATAYVEDKIFIRDTLTPMQNRFAEKLTTIVEKFIPTGRFVFDTAEADDPETNGTLAGQYVNTGAMSPNDVRERFLKLPRVPNPAMDKYYLPLNLVPVESLSFTPAPAEEPAAEEPDAEEPEPDGEEEETPKPFRTAPEPKRKATPMQVQILRMFLRQRLLGQRRFQPTAAKLFLDQGERMAKKWLRLTGEREFDPINKIELFDQLFNLAAENNIWRGITDSFQVAQMNLAFGNMADVLGYSPDIAFESGAAAFEVKRERLASRVTGINEVTRTKLRKVLAQGIEMGFNPTVIANGDPETGYPGIRGTFTKFSQNRAQLIARTESAGALEQGNTEVYKGVGIATVDVIGCEDSVIVEGQTWGCNSRGIPTAEAEEIVFHPNHLGAIVPNVLVNQSHLAARALLLKARAQHIVQK